MFSLIWWVYPDISPSVAIVPVTGLLCNCSILKGEPSNTVYKLGET